MTPRPCSKLWFIVEAHTAKQVRCDAASLGVPCTNCVAFQIECRIPVPKRKKGQTAGTEKEDRFVFVNPLKTPFSPISVPLSIRGTVANR